MYLNEYFFKCTRFCVVNLSIQRRISACNDECFQRSKGRLRPDARAQIPNQMMTERSRLRLCYVKKDSMFVNTLEGIVGGPQEDIVTNPPPSI